MKYRSITIAILFVIGYSGLQAQDVVDASGGDATGSGGSASYSVGQVTYTTVSGANGSIEQGVQLPYEIFVTTGKDLEYIDLGFSAYPNPTKGQLFLVIDDYDNEKLSYQLIDLQGRILEDKPVQESRTHIDMNRFTQATYFLKVSDNNTILKTFKIIKN